MIEGKTIFGWLKKLANFVQTLKGQFIDSFKHDIMSLMSETGKKLKRLPIVCHRITTFICYLDKCRFKV